MSRYLVFSPIPTNTAYTPSNAKLLGILFIILHLALSAFPLELQIVSDLHLETPLFAPNYTKYHIKAEASNLCLLGDIGLVKDDALFTFLRTNLTQSRGHRIFYVIGNHEAYHISFEDAVKRLRAFEEEAKLEFGGRFVLLHRNRYDLDDTITLLGCPLWSAISQEQAKEAQARLTDFNEERGIRGWSLESHITHHQQEGSNSNVAILTHHSPNFDPRATNPRHQGSTQSTCFATDLSAELCWTSPIVKLWAFGHTHYTCSSRDEATHKLVIANQSGYHSPGRHRKMKTMVIALEQSGWKTKEIKSDIRESDGEETKKSNANIMTSKREGLRVSEFKKVAGFFSRFYKAN